MRSRNSLGNILARNTHTVPEDGIYPHFLGVLQILQVELLVSRHEFRTLLSVHPLIYLLDFVHRKPRGLSIGAHLLLRTTLSGSSSGHFARHLVFLLLKFIFPENLLGLKLVLSPLLLQLIEEGDVCGRPIELRDRLIQIHSLLPDLLAQRTLLFLNHFF